MDLGHVDGAFAQVPVAEPERCDGIDKRAAVTNEHDRAGPNVHGLGCTLGNEIEHLVQIEGRADRLGNVVEGLDELVRIG